jgi:hypothetical protein
MTGAAFAFLGLGANPSRKRVAVHVPFPTSGLGGPPLLHAGVQDHNAGQQDEQRPGK